MQSTFWPIATVTVGTLLVGLGLFADHLGIGQPGFGERQTVLFVVGLFCLLAGLLAFRRSSASSANEGTWFDHMHRGYVGFAVLLLNTLLLVIVLNGALWLGFAVTDRLGWTVAEPESEGLVSVLAILRVTRLAAFWTNLEQDSPLSLSDDELASIYPGWTREDVAYLLRESRGRKLGYEPFSQFGEQAYTGRYVNVSEHGFRIAPRRDEWPMLPDMLNVWVFGGSTTFGYGLPDAETIPAHLAAELAPNVAVYNFGQGYFYSSQELALFYRLLVSTEVLPEFVIFIDGINESMAEPFYSEALRTMVRAPYQAPYARVQPRPLADGDQVFERYLKNQSLIRSWCEPRNIRPIFVWQPSPAWQYDLAHHLFPSDDFQPRDVRGQHLGQSSHYASMARKLEATQLGASPNFLDLSGIQADVEKPLYVDHVHYTAEMSRTIAERISERVTELSSN